MKAIIVREYLSSLKESEELDLLFPMLLEVMGMQIISTPKQTKGLAQYGKDVVAVGIDPVDQIKKRFYFEVKGGNDKNITTQNYNANDGIRESIIEAKDRPFRDSSMPGFETLPIKIVLVHNGELKANVKETFDGFIQREFPKMFQEEPGLIRKLWLKTRKTNQNHEHYEFERWDIYKLTELFGEYLFGEYLLTNEERVTEFKRVLVLLNNPQNDFSAFYHLVNQLILDLDRLKDVTKFNRKQKALFETFNLITYIVISYSKVSKNLEPAKRSIPYLILRLWGWLIENNKSEEKVYKEYFSKIVSTYLSMLNEYFHKMIPIAEMNHGLWAENGGKYEQVGYPVRTMEFIEYLIFYFSCIDSGLVSTPNELSRERRNEVLVNVICSNASARPLLDNHSIPIFLIINSLLQIQKNLAVQYLSGLVENIQIAYKVSKRLPDGGNNLETVMKFMITSKKSVYYTDSTSLLFGMIFEFLGILDMEQNYQEFRSFVIKQKIDIGVFIPYDDDTINEFLPESEGSLESRLFVSTINEAGYQSEVKLPENFGEFVKTLRTKNEFEYVFQTDKIGLTPVKILAHIFYKTPFFPNSWRNIKDF